MCAYRWEVTLDTEEFHGRTFVRQEKLQIWSMQIMAGFAATCYRVQGDMIEMAPMYAKVARTWAEALLAEWERE